MDAARAAIGKITGRTGHQTDVDETVNPAVTSETVKPHRHEETTEAVDREVHQDHYHTTVQPVQHQEVLPEQHTHNLIPQVEREVHHGDREADTSRVASELGQFKDTSVTHDTTHSTQAAPQAVGEHTHHHVHETVQPVIHKETIQPEVVHTTIPIHEKHIAPSEHHGISQLPTKTMDEVKQMGLNLGSGGHSSREEYEGHPRPYSADLQLERAPADIEPRKHDGTHDPEATGHREWLGGVGGKPLAESGTTGSSTERGLIGASGAAPVHQSHDEHHGAGTLAGGALGGAAAGSAVGGLSNEHNINRSAGNYNSGSTGSTGTPLGQGLDGNTGTANTAGRDAGLAGVGGAGAAAGAAGSNLTDHDRTTTGQTGTSNTSSVHDELAKLPGHRRTASGAYTNADQNPSYGKTAGGYLTGADGRHGPQDSSSTSTTTQAAEGAAAGAATGAAAHETSKHESPATQQGSAENSGKRDFGDEKDVQHASKLGEDPSLETAKGGKLTGTGADGSHSAVFGLTPDGHKYDDTHSQTTKLEKSGDDSGVGPAPDDEDKKGTSGVASQIDRSDVAEPKHEGKGEYNPQGESSSQKPGMGGSTVGMEGDTGRTRGNDIGN